MKSKKVLAPEPAVGWFDWRAAGSSQMFLVRRQKQGVANLRLDLFRQCGVRSISSARMASDSSCIALGKSSIEILIFNLTRAAAREAIQTT